eukprot:jgi/Chlat1/2255/Chrsp17S02568
MVAAMEAPVAVAEPAADVPSKAVEQQQAPDLEAWYMDDSNEDQRLPHRRAGEDATVSVEMLEKLGVLSWKLDPKDPEHDPLLAKLREERGYSYMDIIEVSPEKLENYEQKLKYFYEEHIHTDEEIRVVLGGSGYFDIRDLDDKWIRIFVRSGNMIVLPEGSYHRFSLDSDNYIKALRLFIGDPVWTPLNRPQEEHASRSKYLAQFDQKEVACEPAPAVQETPAAAEDAAAEVKPAAPVVEAEPADASLKRKAEDALTEAESLDKKAALDAQDAVAPMA